MPPALATVGVNVDSPIMALAVISDIHGNLSALNAVLADINRHQVTQIVNLGDSLSGPFDAAGTADRLIALELPTVRGNHDRQLVDRPPDRMGNWESWAIGDLMPEHLDWIHATPLTMSVGEVFLCHGTPERDDANWLDRRGADNRMIARDLTDVEILTGSNRHPLMLCGHTHEARVVRLIDGTMIVNPGSVGCPAYLDTRTKPHFVHQTGAPDARYAIVDKRDGRWTADLIAVPYDPTPMVEHARGKNAESWVRAITTGWSA